MKDATQIFDGYPVCLNNNSETTHINSLGSGESLLYW